MVHVPYQTFKFVVNNQRLSNLIVKTCHYFQLFQFITQLLICSIFLRVTDVLFNHLVLDVRRKDALVKCQNESILDGCDNLHKLESFFASRFPHSLFFYCKDTKDLKWRDLMGLEKLIVFSKINFLTFLRDLPNIGATQLLWKKYKICMICYTMKRLTLVVQSNLKKRQNNG